LSAETSTGIASRLKVRLNELIDGIKITLRPKLRIANFLAGLLPAYASGALRTMLYRWAGFQIEKSAFIIGNIRFYTGQKDIYTKLKVGSQVVIGHEVVLNLDTDITIEDNVSIGPHVLIYTGTHPLGRGSMRRMPQLLAKPVKLERGCWVGLGAIILPGVTVGAGSVVAAGSVIKQNVPPHTLVEGNPAVVVQKLPWANS
jgi:maltose O-acetyltransferase